MRRALLATVIAAAVLSPRTASAEDDASPRELVRSELTEQLRHRLPARMRTVLDTALILHDLRALPYAMGELWSELRADPVMRAIYANLAAQYRPHLVASGYTGAIGESSRYLGAGLGVEADFVAPLCRYLGGSFDGQAYDDPAGSGLSWSGRITGCLPWGPFAIELGYLTRRDVRVSLGAPPTSPAGRYDAEGYELRIRGFRWIEPAWEVVTIPAEVVFLDATPSRNGSVESGYLTIDSALLRYLRYGQGPGGRDRVLEVFPIRVTSQVDSAASMLRATVIDVGAVRLSGTRIGPGLYLDASLSFQEGSIRTTGEGNQPPPALASAITAGVEAAVHLDLAPFEGTVRYRRGLVPDPELRVLAEDRAEIAARRIAGRDSAGAGAFLAYTRTIAVPPDLTGRPAAATYGAHLEYGRILTSSLYLTARTEAAKSFYAEAGAPLADPIWEARASLGVAASWSHGP